jgi:hypothetical protein
MFKHELYRPKQEFAHKQENVNVAPLSKVGLCT